MPVRPRPSPAASSQELAALLAAHAAGPAVFTRHGLAVVDKLRSASPDPNGTHRPAPGIPHWDAPNWQLWFGGEAILEFKRLAPAEMPVLDALQAAGWPAAGVPNPFRRPGVPAEVARRRLHNAVKLLNRGLRPRLRLREDGDRVWLCGRPVGGATSPNFP